MKDGALRRSEFHSELDFIPVPNISIDNEVKMEQSTHAMSDNSSTSNNNNNNNNKDKYTPRVTKVCEADILRVHEWDYIDHLRRQCCRAELANGGGGGLSSSSSSLDPLSNAKSPSYQSMSNNISKSSSSNNLSSEQVIDQARQMENNNNNNGGGGGGVNQDDRGMIAGFFDSDTRLSPGSWNAAQAAVDACLTAVDTVMKDFSRKSDNSSSAASPNNNNNSDTAADVSHRKAFVAARPPGHHGNTK
jgi:acetoin utilization deacetylase AcuC-like enzyme